MNRKYVVQLTEEERSQLKQIITTVRRAYCEGSLEAALQRKKPEREYPHLLDGEAEAHLIAMACSQPPEGHARWSLRLLRDRFVEAGYVEQVSHETIRQVLKGRTETLAQEAIWYSPAEECGVCLPNGGGVGGLSTPLCPPATPGLHR